MPSTASADWPRATIPRESARWASIGCSAPSIRHISCRASATDTGAVFSAISRASAPAASSSSPAGCRLRSSPAFEALLRREDPTRRDPLHRAADADDARQEPARAGLGDDAAAREDEAHARLLGGQANVHRQRHRRAHAHSGAVDRSDHGLLRLKHAQRELAAVVALGAPRGRALVVVEGVAAAAEVGARAEATPGARHDHRAHLVVGVGAVEGRHQLAAHLPRPGVQPLGPVERDRQHAVGQLGGDLGRLAGDLFKAHARHSLEIRGARADARRGRGPVRQAAPQRAASASACSRSMLAGQAR